MTVSNATLTTGSTLDISTKVSGNQGGLTYKIKTNGTTTASTLSGSTLTAGAMSADNDTAQTVVVTVTAAGNTNYNSGSKDITITVQKKANTIAANNQTVYVSSTTPLSSLVKSNIGGALSGTKGTDNEGGATKASISGTNFVAGTLAASDDANKTVAVTIKAARTTTVAEKSVNVTVTVQKYDRGITITAPTANQEIQYNKTVTAAATNAGSGGTPGTITFTSGTTSVFTCSGTNGATIKAVKSTGTSVITATRAATETVKAKTATVTVKAVKCVVGTPTNLAVSTAGVVTWTAGANSTGHQISIDGTNWTSATSGVNYLSTITAATGSRTVYVRAVNSDTTNYTTPSGNATKAVTVYSVALTKGTGIASVSGAGNYISGATVTLGATMSTGYNWSKWTQTSGGANVSTTKAYSAKITGNWAYKANATAKTYTLTLNPNGGTYNNTTDNSKKTMTYNSTNNNSIGVPTRTDYRFDGWYTAATGGTQVYNASGQNVSASSYWTAAYSSGKWKYDGNVTLYAHWTQYNYVGQNSSGQTQKYYMTLAQAFAETSTSVTMIVPLVDTEETTSAYLNRNMTLKLDNKTISFKNTSARIYVHKNATLTIANGQSKGGKIVNAGSYAIYSTGTVKCTQITIDSGIYVAGGSLTLDGATVNASNSTGAVAIDTNNSLTDDGTVAYGNVLIKGTTLVNSTSGGSGILNYKATNLTVQNTTINAKRDGISIRDVNGTTSSMSSFTISNSSIRGEEQEGIDLVNCQYANVTLTSNTINGNGEGVYYNVKGSAGNRVSLDITDSNITATTKEGLDINTCEYADITVDSYIFSYQDDGIELNTCNKVTLEITSNETVGGNLAALALQHNTSTAVHVDDANLYGNTYGLWTSDDKSTVAIDAGTVKGNRQDGTNGYGIATYNGSTTAITLGKSTNTPTDQNPVVYGGNYGLELNGETEVLFNSGVIAARAVDVSSRPVSINKNKITPKSGYVVDYPTTAQSVNGVQPTCMVARLYQLGQYVQVTLDPSPGSGGTSKIFFYNGNSTIRDSSQIITKITVPTRSGYTFKGYYGDGTAGGNNGETYIYGYGATQGAGALASDLTTDIYKSTTFKAKWEQNTKGVATSSIKTRTLSLMNRNITVNIPDETVNNDVDTTTTDKTEITDTEIIQNKPEEISVGDKLQETETTQTENTTVVELPKVAEIDGVTYSSIAEAIESISNTATIKLLDNIELTDELVIQSNQNITLDLNGKTLTSTAINTINNQGTLTIIGTGVIKNETENGTTIYNTGTVNLNSGVITTSANGGKAINNSSGTVNITGGKVVTEGLGAIAIYNINNGKGNVKGGIVETRGFGSKAIYNDAKLEVNNAKVNVANDDSMAIYNGSKAMECIIKDAEIVIEEKNIENYELIKNTDEFKAELEQMKPSYGIYNDSNKEVQINTAVIKVERLKGIGICNNSNGIITLGIENDTVNEASPIVYAIADYSKGIVNSEKGIINYYDGKTLTLSSVKDMITNVLRNYRINEDVGEKVINTTLVLIEEDKGTEVTR